MAQTAFDRTSSDQTPETDSSSFPTLDLFENRGGVTFAPGEEVVVRDATIPETRAADLHAFAARHGLRISLSASGQMIGDTLMIRCNYSDFVRHFNYLIVRYVHSLHGSPASCKPCWSNAPVVRAGAAWPGRLHLEAAVPAATPESGRRTLKDAPQGRADERAR